jgi:ATP-dependent Clp protease protease subunit
MPTDDQLLENRELVLRGVIDDKLANEVVAKLLFLQHKDGHAPITLHIDSPGGSVSAGLAIVDTIDYVSPPVRTCCHSLAAAMATIIAAHGARGYRLAGSDSKLLLSEAYVDQNVTAQDGEVDKVNRILTEFVARDTGRSFEEVTWTIKAGAYLSASQAKDFGLIDAIGCCCRSLRPDIPDRPEPKFHQGQHVRVILNEQNRTPHSGTIRQIIWHFKDQRYNYYLEEEGKNVTKRYLDCDLESMD